MSDLLKDVQYGFRLLWKAKAFTLVAAVSLALGIGFNTTIFSAVDSVLLKPIRFLDPDSLVEIYLSDSRGLLFASSSYPDYREYRDRTDVFSGIVSSHPTTARYEVDGSSEYLSGEVVSGNYFEVLGIPSMLGRTIELSDDLAPGGHPVVVVSERFWRSRLGGLPDALGKTLDLNGRPYTIVGVLPSGFTGTLPGFFMQFWAPSSMVDPLDPYPLEGSSRLERRSPRFLFVKARLAPGVTLERAQGQLDSLLARLEEEYPADYRDRRIDVVPSEEVRINPVIDGALFPVAGVLMAVVGLVLLIACGNVANMLLARAVERRDEVALRLALGASRFRLVRQLLTESVLLSSLGGLLGLLLAHAATRLLLSFKPPVLVPVALDLTLSYRVLFFTLVVSVATGILFGLVPAWEASRASLIAALKSEPLALGRRRLSLRNALVVVQVTFSLMLLIGAALLLRSARNAQAIDPGFETEKIVMFSTNLGLHGYSDARGRDFYRLAVERVAALPGIAGASLTDKVPLGGDIAIENVSAEGRELEMGADGLSIDSSTISPGYFRVMGVPIREGRDFAWNDSPESPRVAILNETAARRLWPGESAIGKRVVRGAGGSREYFEVIGIVSDAKVRTLGEDARPQIYRSFGQDYSPMMHILARTRGNPQPALGSVRHELLSMDASLAFFEARTMPQNLEVAFFPVRMGAFLFSLFGGLALLLTSVGLYGVVSYSVGRRTREIGIRMAMGASRSHITALVTRQGLTLVCVGVAFGWGAALLGARALSSVLYGIGPNDVLTFAGTAVVLSLVAFVASWIPARRASRMTPLTALRYE